MRQLVGRLLIAGSLVAYGVGTLVGPALHALPGCDHHDLGGSSSHAPESSSSSTTHDDCLICQAIDAASISLAAPGAPFLVTITIAEVATAPLATSHVPIGLHVPRAPPGKRSASVPLI